MKMLKSKLLIMLSSGLLTIAIQSVNLISSNHIYQEKELDSLKNMKGKEE